MFITIESPNRHEIQARDLEKPATLPTSPFVNLLIRHKHALNALFLSISISYCHKLANLVDNLKVVRLIIKLILF